MMTDTEFFPRSAQVNFEFYVPDIVKDSAKFKALEEETALAVTEIRKELKRKVLKCLNIEIETWQTQLQEHFASSIRLCTEASLMSLDSSSTNTDVVISKIVAANTTDLLKHVALDANTFNTTYAKVHGLSSFPPSQTADTPMSESDGNDEDNGTATTSTTAGMSTNSTATEVLSPFFVHVVTGKTTFLQLQARVKKATLVKARRNIKTKKPLTRRPS